MALRQLICSFVLQNMCQQLAIGVEIFTKNYIF